MRQRLGQHFLHDQTVIDTMIGLLKPLSDDLIVEVGSGTGVLTSALLNSGQEVLAIEWDEELYNKLANQYESNGKLTIIHADIRHLNLVQKIDEMGLADYKIVANLPYYLTSYLFRQIFAYDRLPKQVIVLIQKEVAERVSAPVGSSRRGVLSVLCQAYGTPRIALNVPASSFTPAPKVESAVLVIDNISNAKMANIDQKEFMRVVKAGFGEKRKTIENALAGGFTLSKITIQGILQKAGIDTVLRAQNLTIEQWIRLYYAVKEQ